MCPRNAKAYVHTSYLALSSLRTYVAVPEEALCCRSASRNFLLYIRVRLLPPKNLSQDVVDCDAWFSLTASDIEILFSFGV